MLLASSALAALLGRCWARCYMLASATAVTIASNVNKALGILLSVVLFNATMTLYGRSDGEVKCRSARAVFLLVSQKKRCVPGSAIHKNTCLW